MELDVTQQCLSFGDEIVDHLVTSSLDDDLLGRLSGLLRLGDGKGNLAFELSSAGGAASSIAAATSAAGAASIRVGSSVVSPVVAHPAQIRDASIRVRAVFFILLIFSVTFRHGKYQHLTSSICTVGFSPKPLGSKTTSYDPNIECASRATCSPMGKYHSLRPIMSRNGHDAMMTRPPIT